MSNKILVSAEFTAKTNMIERLLQELDMLVPLTRLESGCIEYTMYKSLENKDKVLMVERFKNRQAFDFHLQTNYVRNFVDNLMPVLVEEVKFGIWQEVP